MEKDNIHKVEHIERRTFRENKKKGKHGKKKTRGTWKILGNT